jgi:hypothetical protein
VKEGEPFKVKLDEIQARYNVYIAPTKNKVPGKVPVAMEALKAALKPFLDKLEAEQSGAGSRGPPAGRGSRTEGR